MKQYCYANGKIVALAKAGVPVNDIGLLRGYGVFDFFRTYNGKPFHFKEHFARFKRSAKTIGLTVPISGVEVERLIAQLLKKNKDLDSSFRLVLTGGTTDDGISLSRPNFYILAEDLYLPPATVYDRGAKLITCDYQRIFPGAKNTNYLQAVYLQKQKIKQQAIEILYLDQGRVLEASTSNIFLIKGDTAITPKENILHGITRHLVGRLARQHKIKVVERRVTFKELLKADEVFITATNKKIIPIVKINEQTIGHGRIGVKTKILMTAFAEYVKNY